MLWESQVQETNGFSGGFLTYSCSPAGESKSQGQWREQLLSEHIWDSVLSNSPFRGVRGGEVQSVETPYIRALLNIGQHSTCSRGIYHVGVGQKVIKSNQTLSPRLSHLGWLCECLRPHHLCSLWDYFHSLTSCLWGYPSFRSASIVSHFCGKASHWWKLYTWFIPLYLERLLTYS